SLVAALAVVPEAGDDAPEGLRARIEASPPGVVLEPREGSTLAGIELAVEQHVADHPLLAGDRLEREQADAGHVLAVEAPIAAAEQLVSAADGEERRATLDDGFDQRLRLRGEVLRDEVLLAILPAADVIEIVCARLDRILHADGGDVELVAAPGG